MESWTSFAGQIDTSVGSSSRLESLTLSPFARSFSKIGARLASISASMAILLNYVCLINI